MIGGKVTDEIGEPVRGATITIFRENHFAGVSRVETSANVATDDQGTYEARLPGNWNVFRIRNIPALVR